LYASTFVLVVLYTGPYGIFHPSQKRIKGQKKKKKKRKKKKEKRKIWAPLPAM
jgi:hypothetical protein